jgi:hypothetical protein
MAKAYDLLTGFIWNFGFSGFIAWLVTLNGVHNPFLIGGISGLGLVIFNYYYQIYALEQKMDADRKELEKKLNNLS